MKCFNCNAEWTLPQNPSKILINCPFCGEALDSPKPKQLNTVEDVLMEIRIRFGIDTLGNGQKMIALFSDLAPNMRRERLLLSYLIKGGGNSKLLSVRSETITEQQACFHLVCKNMVEEQFIAEEAARKICMSFSSVIGLMIHAGEPEKMVNKSTQVSSSVTTSVPSKTTGPTRNPATKPGATPGQTIVSKTINTFAQYQKALEEYYLNLGKAPLSESQIHYFITSRSLDRTRGITVSDVQKDLKVIYDKYNQQTPVSKHSPKINSYAEYQKALEDYYLRLGKVKLSRNQVDFFIWSNSLKIDWNITNTDVEKDLKSIYAKYSQSTDQSKAVANTAVVYTFPRNIRIRTYAEYLRELEQAYLQNGKKMLTKAQIMAFLNAYNLERDFDIRVSEVETDLREIEKKYCI